MAAVGRVYVPPGEGHDPIVVTTHSVLPWPALITLDEGARLSVDTPVSGHVLSFLGPAIVAPCTRGEDHASVVAGRFQTDPDAGAPNGVETIVTPFAVVRYTRATLTLTVTSDETTADLTDGEATACDDETTSFAPLTLGARMNWTGPALTVDGAATAVARCEADVAAARQLDLRPRSEASEARARVAHGAARAHCSIAELRVSALPRPSEPRASLVLRLDGVGLL